MASRVVFRLAVLSFSLAVALPSARAQVVGDVKAIYFAPNGFGVSPSDDGPAFVFENTSGTAITNGVFSIGVGGDNATPDALNVGTIPAGSFVVVEPGVFNDGGAGHTFFLFTGSVRDTSDGGPSGDAVPFEFTGLQSGQAVDSGIFTPAATRGPTNDNAISDMNFLGGPGGNDGPCNNCFGPKTVALLSLPAANVPEPGSLAMLASMGLSTLGIIMLRRRRV